MSDSVIKLWVPSYHDPEFKALHKLYLSDAEIGDRMHFPPSEVTKARKRLALKANIPLKPKFREREGAVSGKPDPLAIAQKLVEGFNRLNMTLDGKPVKLDAIMKLANKRLKANQRDQIGPSHWRV